MYCPLTNKEEEVFFHEVSTSDGYRVRFDGCDRQFSSCEECEECHKHAYQKLISQE
jgi:hypothetical protein